MPYSYARPVVREVAPMLDRFGNETAPSVLALSTDRSSTESQLCETYLWYIYNVDGFGMVGYRCEWDRVWLTENLASWG